MGNHSLFSLSIKKKMELKIQENSKELGLSLEEAIGGKEKMDRINDKLHEILAHGEEFETTSLLIKHAIELYADTVEEAVAIGIYMAIEIVLNTQRQQSNPLLSTLKGLSSSMDSPKSIMLGPFDSKEEVDAALNKIIKVVSENKTKDDSD